MEVACGERARIKATIFLNGAGQRDARESGEEAQRERTHVGIEPVCTHTRTQRRDHPSLRCCKSSPCVRARGEDDAVLTVVITLD